MLEVEGAPITKFAQAAADATTWTVIEFEGTSINVPNGGLFASVASPRRRVKATLDPYSAFVGRQPIPDEVEAEAARQFWQGVAGVDASDEVDSQPQQSKPRRRRNRRR